MISFSEYDDQVLEVKACTLNCSTGWTHADRGVNLTEVDRHVNQVTLALGSVYNISFHTS